MWFKTILSTLYTAWLSTPQPNPSSYSTGLHLQVPASTITLGTYHFWKYPLIPTQMCSNHALTLSQPWVYILPVEPFHPNDFTSLPNLWQYFFHSNSSVYPFFPHNEYLWTMISSITFLLFSLTCWRSSHSVGCPYLKGPLQTTLWSSGATLVPVRCYLGPWLCSRLKKTHLSRRNFFNFPLLI